MHVYETPYVLQRKKRTRKKIVLLVKVIFHWLSETKEVENVYLTHCWGLGRGSGLVTCNAGSCFCCPPLLDLPSHSPTLFLQYFHVYAHVNEGRIGCG